MNNVTLMGRLTRDPQDGFTSEVVKFNVAVNRKYRKGDFTADFIPCTAFGKTGEIVKEYFHKGNRIGVQGRIQTGSYEGKDGNKVYTWEVIAESVEFVDPKEEKQEDDSWQDTAEPDFFM